MELRVLRYFLTVAQEQSITRAAEVLHITQPTLSRQLTQLEEELGVRLFVRGKRRAALTGEGELLYRRAADIVELADRTEQEFGGSAQELSGTVSIGSGESSAAGILPRLLETFSRAHPKVRYDLISGNADQLRERLDKGLMDAAILMEPADVERYEFLRIPDTDRWGVLMPAGDPLAQKEAVTPADLRGLPILCTRRALVQKQLSGWFGAEFDQLDIFGTHNLIRNAALLVEHGLGYAVTLEGAVDIYDRKRVCFRPLAPELLNRAVLVWRKYQAAGPAAAAFLECAKMLLRHDN